MNFSLTDRLATDRLLTVLIWFLLAGFAWSQEPAPPPVVAATAGSAAIEPGERAGGWTSPAIPNLPAPPRGKASLMGGTIRHVDQLRDEITLQFFGGGSAKVLFDGRTRVEHEGGGFALRDLKDGQRVYLETVLDGKDVFARSIRVVTDSGPGQTTGQIISYRSDTGELTLNDALSPRPLKLRLTAESKVLWEGHTLPPTQLQPGSLIEADFMPSAGSLPVAGRISILAEPGHEFVFSGRVVHLDLRTGLLVLLNSQDGKNYQVFLNPDGTLNRDKLREGADVTVNTKFDGNKYAVNSITFNPGPAPSN